MTDPTEMEKSPRLIRRGDIVKTKGTDQDAVVIEVMVVLRLNNGGVDSYNVTERVMLGTDADLSPEDLAAAAALDATDHADG